MPPSAFIASSTIRTKTISTPTKNKQILKDIVVNEISQLQQQQPEQQQPSPPQQQREQLKYNQNNNCQWIQNFNQIHQEQEQQLNNMVLQSYENYATYHLPTHHTPPHHHLHQNHNNHQQLHRIQQLPQQTQTLQQHQSQMQLTSTNQQPSLYHEQYQESQPQQQQQQPPQSLQQNRLSSGSNSNGSNSVGPATAAALGIGYFNDLSNFIGGNSDFIPSSHHASSNLYYTDIDGNFFSQGNFLGRHTTLLRLISSKNRHFPIINFKDRPVVAPSVSLIK